MSCGSGELQFHEYCRHVYPGEQGQTLDAEARLRIPKDAIVVQSLNNQAVELEFDFEGERESGQGTRKCVSCEGGTTTSRANPASLLRNEAEVISTNHRSTN